GDYWRALQAFNANIVSHPLPIQDASLGDDLPQDGDRSVALTSAFRYGESTLSSSGLLLNNPHNPTGQLFSRSAILPLLEQFALVVIDEAFMDFLLPEQQQSLIDLVPHYPNLVVIRSLTKFYSLPGLRLGYAIAHPDRLHRWQQWRDPWSVNSLAEVAAIAAIQDIPFQQQTWNWLTSARSQLWQGIAAQPGLYPLPGAANFLLVQCDRSVKALQQQLLKHHQILIRDCLSFPELGDRYFRVAVRTEAENQRLIDGLAKTLERFVHASE
ncbi:MAG TPA: aminotransferase class I/II-fold pyridoxal phosphate-dependent enzyme, partial [Allocoleopsis sp.]